MKLKYKNAVPEEYFAKFTQDYPSLKPYHQLAINISNAQTPIKEMIDLAHDLKCQGYTLHIFSNIGESIFADLAQQYPTVFSLFDKVHVPDRHTKYIGKRHQDGFSNYLSACNTENKTIILIDDNKHNITRSAQAGMVSIYFKNVQQLHTDLHKLQIL